MKNGFLVILFSVLGLSLIAQPKLGSKTYGVKTVVIDAGHGGKDPGAVGKNSKEKDIALALAQKVKGMLNATLPNMKVILTRDSDVFIPLNKRAEIANSNHADLFISIHCNSNGSSSPHGNETFIMGESKEAANLAVAQKENSVILQEDDYLTNYDGYDPNNPSSIVTGKFFVAANMMQSLELAANIQQNFAKTIIRKDRGVKKAGFLVLYKTTMPSVLVEAGFISNPDEEKFLMSTDGQNKTAKSIFKAIETYAKKYQGTIEEDPTDKRPMNLDLTPEAFKGDQPVMTVQLASGDVPADLTKFPYNRLSKVYEARFNGIYKYYYQTCTSADELTNLIKDAKEVGFKDAFPVAFYKGNKIKIKKAKELLNIE